MWKSKKRLLLLGTCLVLGGGIAAAGIGFGSDWLNDDDVAAAQTPPAPESGKPAPTPAPTPPASEPPTPSLAKVTPPAATPGFAPPPLPLPPTQPQPRVVRGNDGGSLGTPSVGVPVGDQPPSGGGFNPPPEIPTPGGSNPPPSYSPPPVEAAPAPPIGLTPPAGGEPFQQPSPERFSPSASTSRIIDSREAGPSLGSRRVEIGGAPTLPQTPPPSPTPGYGGPAVDESRGLPSPLSNQSNYGNRLGTSVGGPDPSNSFGRPAGRTLAGDFTPGVGVPGPKQLEGLRTPSLTVEKIAPPEIQVGKQATFEIKVRNVGQVDAEQVVVFDQTPKGTRYVTSSPEAARAPDGSLMWQLGTLKAGEEAVVSVQLIPLEEGKIGSVARVAFQAQASASTICTKPLLTVEHTGPSSVLIGETVNLQILISNPGTGVATGVIIEEDVPDGLSHASGNELEFEIGQLRPGESRKVELQLTAEKPGLISNLLVVRGEGNLIAEDRLEMEVIAPRLGVAMTGPSRRYLERQATYSVAVQNPGTAPAQNIELVAYLPKGLKFVSTNNQGQYDAQNHAVYWSLEELPPRMSGEVEVTALPIETGQQKLRVEGRGDLGLSARFEQEVVVEGLAELFFQVVDQADPIEVGSKTVYEVRIVNQGSKTDTNVRVLVQFPPGLRPVGGDGPTRVRADGQTVVCEPLARLAPKETAVYKFTATGYQPGDQRIRVQIESDEMGTPVAKEESTRVYSDQ